MCQPATKRIVLAFLIYFMSKLNSIMKEIVPKRDLWSRYSTKSAAVGCKQAANDDERCQSFGLDFPTFAQIIRWYRCHNLPQTTWLYKSTSINDNLWLRQRNLSPPVTYFHRLLSVHIKVTCDNLANAATSLPQHFLIIIKSRKQILNHCGLYYVNEVLHYNSCQFGL